VTNSFLEQAGEPVSIFIFVGVVRIMETYVVSALKYRPQTFDQVVGQKAITQTLENAIEKNQLAQALLFCGPRGVGKTSCARILAKKINSQGTENKNEDFAFNIFELDAASNNSVDDIRALNEQVRIPPQVGTHKVYIIDEVHMLSMGAFNAFLKTLEEPPKHVIFILATTEKQKIIPTILSRCQTYDFKRISVKDCRDHLQKIAKDQSIVFEPDALDLIAQKADGALRDALSIFDRMVNFTDRKLTVQSVSENLNILDHDTFFTITQLILDHDIPELLLAFDDLLQKGFDELQFITGLGNHFRNLMVSKENRTLPLLEVGEAIQEKFKSQTDTIPLSLLLQGIDLASKCELDYKNTKNKRLLIELCLMQMASLHFGEQ
jgi:DNA polymerase-3 subunit gamma/tau